MLKNTIEYKRFVWEFENCIEKNRNIVFVCIGTVSVIGDSFGPVVGTVLKKRLNKNNGIEVIGDIYNCITYDKIQNYMNQINDKYSNSLIIILDSALSNEFNIGKIFIQNRGLKYAESLKKKNSVIGNISIKAVVGENSYDRIKNFNNLRMVSYQRIHYVSNIVANGIIEVMNKKVNNGKNIYKWNS